MSHEKLVRVAIDCLERAKYWADFGLFSRAAEYQAQAVGLINFVEVARCGSVGGFEKGQPNIPANRDTVKGLQHRLDWLIEKECRCSSTS